MPPGLQKTAELLQTAHFTNDNGGEKKEFGIGICKSQDDLAVMCTDSLVRLFDATTLQCSSVVKQLAKDYKLATKVVASENGQLLVGGSKGFLALVDKRTGGIAEHFIANGDGVNYEISVFDLDPNRVVSGTGNPEEREHTDTYIRIWDRRNPKKEQSIYKEAHSSTISSLQLRTSHQGIPMLLTAGWDGIMNLYKIDEAEEDDALRQTIPQNQKADIQCARFINDETIASMTFGLEIGIRTIQISDDLPYDSSDTFVLEQLEPSTRDLVDLINTGQDKVSVVAVHGDDVHIMPYWFKEDWKKWVIGNPVVLEHACPNSLVRGICTNEDYSFAYTTDEEQQIKAWNIQGKVIHQLSRKRKAGR